MFSIMSIQVSQSTEDNASSLTNECQVFQERALESQTCLQNSILSIYPPCLKTREVRYAITLLLPTPNWSPDRSQNDPNTLEDEGP
jgi:hypothetical protein